MLRRLTDLERYEVLATDGDLGRVVDFLLDDQHWVVRYLVVATGSLLAEHRTLISPIFFREVEWSTRRFRLTLTRREVADSPNVDLDHPVSRQQEREYYAYYRYTPYWGYSALWGVGASPGMLAETGWHEPPPEPADQSAGDAHLRSAGEVRGYHIEGNDGAIGHVDDFIVDDETWEVRYLVIDTSNWWFGTKVLVAPHWAARVSWQEGKVYVDMSRQAIKDSPPWHPLTAIDREYEERLYAYYGRAPYWARPDSREEAQLVHHSGPGHA